MSFQWFKPLPPNFSSQSTIQAKLYHISDHLRVADSEVKAITINMIIVPYSKFHFLLISSQITTYEYGTLI